MEKIRDKPKVKSLKDFKRKVVDLSQATLHTGTRLGQSCHYWSRLRWRTSIWLIGPR
jgi:hypothetical protein